MQSIKEIYKYLDLYGDSLLIQVLKGQYKKVAYCDKSIPGGGSPCKDSNKVREDLKMKRASFHRNNEVTILTECGNLRFF